jgi:hypothetical protein
VRITGLGELRRADRIAVHQRVQRLAVGATRVRGLELDRGGDPLQLDDRGGGKAGRIRHLGGERSATELRLERGARALHPGDLGARVAGERVLPAEFVEHGAADAHKAVGARLVGRAVESQEGLDQRELARAGQVRP